MTFPSTCDDCRLDQPMRHRGAFVSGLLVPLAMLGLFWIGITEASSQTVVYQAERIWTGDGPPLEKARLVVRDGQITESGSIDEVDVPGGAELVDLGSRVIIPGLIAVQSQSSQGAQDTERALTPEISALDSFDPFAAPSEALTGGVTTAHLVPGRERLLPGRGAVVRLAGARSFDRVLVDRGAVRILLNEDSRKPPSIYEPPVGAVSLDRPLEPTMPQLSPSLSEAVAGLRALFDTARSRSNWRTLDPPLPSLDRVMLESLADAIDERATLWVTAQTLPEIRAAVSLAKRYGLPLVLVDPEQIGTAKQRTEWAETVTGIVLNAGRRPGQITAPSSDDRIEPVWARAATLVREGFHVALRPSNDEDLPDLLFLAGLMTTGGLDEAEALGLVTTAPAEILGVGDRVGTLQPDRRADFVVLTANPFDVRSRVQSVFVEGVDVTLATRPTAQAAESRATVIRAGHLLDGNGNTIESASILVDQGLIRDRGLDVSAPLDAEVRVFPEAVVVPGFVDFASGLGFDGNLSGSIRLGTTLGERIVDQDRRIETARSGGVTTVLVAPNSSSPSPVVAFKLGDPIQVLADPAAIQFTLSSESDSAVAGLKRTLTAGKTYAESWTKYEAQLKEYESKLAQYRVAKARYDAQVKALAARRAREKAEAEKKAQDDNEETPKDDDKENSSDAADSKDSGPGSDPPSEDADKPDDDEEGSKDKDEDPEDSKEQDDESGSVDDSDGKSDESKPEEESGPKPPEEPKKPKEPRKNDALEPYRALFGGEIPALVRVNRIGVIKAAVTLFRDEFDLPTILVGADGGFRDPDVFTNKDLGVALGPVLVRTEDRRTVNLSQLLAARQVPFAFRSGSNEGVADLPLVVRYAVRKGLGVDDALQALSGNAARLIRLQDRIGSLDVGKQADLVVWSGHPMDLSSRVLAVMIDGRWVFEADDQD